jgi:class 3 adenylate cyclase
MAPRLLDRSSAPPGRRRWFGGSVAQATRIADDASVQIPETRYARTVDGLSVAYQTVGRGPPDVVLLRAWHTNVEFDWEERVLAHVFQRIASFGRLIVFDRRGTGLSDRIGGDLPTLEQRMDDIVAVLDAVGSPRAAVIGLAAASMLTATFAATYPQRTQALVLHEPRARGSYAEDYPWSATAEQRRKHREVIETGWGSHAHARELLANLAPSRADDVALVEWLATSQRRSAPPHAAVALATMDYETDIRHVLPALRVPTLVLNRRADSAEESGWIAAQIPGASLVHLPGRDHMLISGDTDAAIDEIERFLTGAVRSAPQLNRILATVLFTDLVESTRHLARVGDRGWAELLDRHHAIVRDLLKTYRGQEVDTTGDGFFATFDGPARAIRCAQEIARSLRPLGLEVRAGIHTGECEIADGKAAGIAVVVAARVMAQAVGGQVLVTNMVKDLVAGSGLTFAAAGAYELKGVPDT